jgi:hypothetical protein
MMYAAMTDPASVQIRTAKIMEGAVPVWLTTEMIWEMFPTALKKRSKLRILP